MNHHKKSAGLILTIAMILSAGVAHAAGNLLAAWGDGDSGQLGNAVSAANPLPVQVDNTGVLKDKTVISVSSGAAHTLAVCSDGTLAAWGTNASAELGIGTFDAGSNVPILVDTSGVLHGKTVTSVAAGYFFSIAVCSDGTAAAWGNGNEGELGTGAGSSGTPAMVVSTGVLAGKKIVKVRAGMDFAVALCDDGTLVSWGNNNVGQLGDNGASGTQSFVPVLVDQTGVLAGKTIVDIAAGADNALVLCSDGTLATWGLGDQGQLGNNDTANSPVPVLVKQDGVLNGKTPTAVSCGSFHDMALCSDGTLATWGGNADGELGLGFTNSSVPIAVPHTGALSGKTITQIVGGIRQSLVLCSDGTLLDWGSDHGGVWGNNDTSGGTSDAAKVVDRTGVLNNGTVTGLAAGGTFNTVIFVPILDTSRPTVTIGFPSANAIFPLTGSPSGTVSGTAIDDVHVNSVEVLLSRVRGGVTSYWSGSAWTTVKSWIPVDVDPNGPKLLTNWRWVSQLPTSADLDAGHYRLDVRGRDSIGPGAAVSRGFDLVNDSSAPTLTLYHPAAGARLTPAEFAAGTVDGLATDDMQLASGTLKLYRVIAGVKQYWDGTAFVNTPTNAPINLDTTNLRSVPVSIATMPSEADLLAGPYWVQGTATDTSGNRALLTRSFYIVTESVKPAVTVDSPLSNATVAAESFDAQTVSGTATDNAQVTSLTVKLFRIRGGAKQYWDGSTWSTAPVTAPIDTTGLNTATVNWNVNSPPSASDLDAGVYSVTVVATDSSGNVSAVLTRNFNVSVASGGVRFNGGSGTNF